MTRASRFVSVLLVGVVVFAVVPGSAFAVDDPRFETVVPEPVLEPGHEQSLQVLFVNDGEGPEDDVKTATNVRVELLAGDTPISVKSGERVLGTMPEGALAETSFRVAVPDSIDPGTYRLPARVTYEFDGNERETSTVYVTVQIDDRARFEVVSTDTNVTVGGTGRVSVTVKNVGSMTARDATVNVVSGDAELVFGGGAVQTQGFLGTVAPGETASVSFKVAVASNALVREYPLSMSVTYTDVDGVKRESGMLTAGVTPQPEQRFSVQAVESSATVGETGYVTVTLQNNGPVTATDASVRVTAPSGELGIGPTGTGAERYVGEWAPNETTEIRLRVAVPPNAAAQTYSVAAAVTYDTQVGLAQPADVVSVSFTPNPEQSFAVSVAEASVTAGQKGSVVLDVRNTGERTARDVTVVMSTEGVLQPRSPAVAVGDLEAGASASVEFTVDVPPVADAGSRRVTYVVEHQDAAGKLQASDPVPLSVSVGQRETVFSVKPVDATFEVDSAGTLTVRVTNNLNEPVTDVTAVLTTTEPLTSDDPVSFVERLGPSESTEVAFHLDVSDDAIPAAHSAAVAFTYDDASGSTVATSPVRFGVTVVPQSGAGVPVIPIAVAVVAVIAAGVWYWYRGR